MEAIACPMCASLVGMACRPDDEAGGPGVREILTTIRISAWRPQTIQNSGQNKLIVLKNGRQDRRSLG